MCAAELPRIFTRAQARAAGLTDRQIDLRLASGVFERVSRGIAQLATQDIDPTAPTRKPLTDLPRVMELPADLAAALLAWPSRDLVVSHQSAARVLGLPKPLAGWGGPQLTAAQGPTRRRSGIHLRVAPLPPEHVQRVRGAPVTAPARTVIDCLRVLPPRDGLAILDAALHRHLVTPDDLLGLLTLQGGWPGISRARSLIMLGDPRRESPLESWTAWAFTQARLVPPEWQTEILTSSGELIGRVDCWWPGVAGEADGRSKYALATAERASSGAQAVFEVLDAERSREQRLRATGAELVRWTTGDVLRANRLTDLSARIRAAIAWAQDGARFTGTVAPVMLQLATVPRPDPSSGRG